MQTVRQLAKAAGRAGVKLGAEVGVGMGAATAAHAITHFGQVEAATWDGWIFSDQMLAQARALDVAINPKNEQSGRYTTLRNNAKDGRAGMYETPVGQKLQALALRWDVIVYGKAVPDGFDFKLNLSNKSFASATRVSNPESQVTL